MKKVFVTARLLAPTIIKKNRQSERSKSTSSIAGTQIRGALASLYLQRYGQVDNKFDTLFLDESACRFGPLDPGPEHFPLTAASCKREGTKHTLGDLLWFRIAQHYMEGYKLPEEVTKPWRCCDCCKQDLKNREGFWQRKDNRLCLADANKRGIAAHVGIDRYTATAAEAIFYTLEAMMPSEEQNVDLYGWLMGNEQALDALKQLLQDEDNRISVGHHRTRGYGDVRLQLAAEDNEPLCKDAWSQWSESLIRVLGEPPFGITEHITALNTEEDFYFSLSFPTGAVLVDRFLRYTLDPAAMVPWLPAISPLDRAFPLLCRPVQPLQSGESGGTRWITAVTKHERLRGWNAAHGLPRQDEWMVARGAVYVYHFRGTAEQRARLVERLVCLHQDGIGLRRNEGLGTVNVSHDFHRHFHQQQKRKVNDGFYLGP